MNLPSTKTLVTRGKYADSPVSFFSTMGSCVDLLRSQIVKLETRQEYQEPDNPSFQAARDGDLEKAIELLPASRAGDISLYEDLEKRGIDFIRCRPISIPLSTYLQWEIEVYKFNWKLGERIFFCNYQSLDAIFKYHAAHDFMIFDSRIAFIHDYDDSGLIRGGWVIEDIDAIIGLHTLFSFIKANCQPFQMFLNNGRG